MKHKSFDQIPIYPSIPNQNSMNATLALGCMAGLCKTPFVVAARLMKLSAAGAIELSEIDETMMDDLSVILHKDYLRNMPHEKENFDMPVLTGVEMKLREDRVGTDPYDAQVFELLKAAKGDSDILTGQMLQDYCDGHTSQFVKVGDACLEDGFTILEKSGTVEKKLFGMRMSEQGTQQMEQTAGYYKYLLQREKDEPDIDPQGSLPYAVLFWAVPEYAESLTLQTGGYAVAYSDKSITAAYYWEAWSKRFKNWIVLTSAAKLNSDNVTAGHMWTRNTALPWGPKINKWL